MLQQIAWNSTEDDILKAAIMKYGTNQWSRISSFLNRRTPAQCKARWFEWLSPDVPKQAWTRSEDQRLVDMVKVMPEQWRTISSVIGRTATQCIERYRQLQNALTATEPEPHLIETVPSKHQLQVEQEDQDMLREARNKLSNMNGKKDRRKIRERLMLEQRRQGLISKRRELLAAGEDFDLVSAMTRNKQQTDHDLITDVKDGPFKVDDESVVRFVPASVDPIELQKRLKQSEQDRQKSQLQKQQLELEELQIQSRGKFDRPKAEVEPQLLILRQQLEARFKSLPQPQDIFSVEIPEQLEVSPYQTSDEEPEIEESSDIIKRRLIQSKVSRRPELPVPLEMPQLDDPYLYQVISEDVEGSEYPAELMKLPIEVLRQLCD